MTFVTEKLLYYYDFSPPIVRQAVHRAARIVFYFMYQLRFLNGAKRLPLKTYSVRVSDIGLVSNRIAKHNLFLKYLFHGVVMGGDWDMEHQPLETTPLYEYSRDVFVNGKQPEKTSYYQQILAGHLEPYIHDERHLQLRLDSFWNLYSRIKSEGYLRQSMLPRGNTLDEICISINRAGKYILEDGRHRFMIAKCLDIETIPVIINRMHADYWTAKQESWDHQLKSLAQS